MCNVSLHKWPLCGIKNMFPFEQGQYRNLEMAGRILLIVDIPFDFNCALRAY